ncbi:MAG: zinc-dependent alcohol dehydrogenase family protein [bacterium JZ-2024 1]
MKAMILEQQGPVESADRLAKKEVAIGVLNPGEVLVRVEACGVCHTDLHIVEGELPLKKRPLVPGHQIVGIVEQTGPDVPPSLKGKRVGVPWFQQSCGSCHQCTRGKENLCDSARFNGYDSDGGYAEFVKLPAGSVYEVPPGYRPAETAPLMCAGVIGFRALNACGLAPGDSLALFGFGASAHIVLQVARARNLRVFVYSRSSAHRELARTLGAEWCGTVGDIPPHPYNGAIVFAPVGALMISALENLAPAGRIVSAGIHMSPIPQFEYRLLYKERTMTTVANSTARDVQDFLNEASAQRIRVEIEVWPLDHANEALRALKAGRINGAAVLALHA